MTFMRKIKTTISIRGKRVDGGVREWGREDIRPRGGSV